MTVLTKSHEPPSRGPSKSSFTVKASYKGPRVEGLRGLGFLGFRV